MLARGDFRNNPSMGPMHGHLTEHRAGQHDTAGGNYRSGSLITGGFNAQDIHTDGTQVSFRYPRTLWGFGILVGLVGVGLKQANAFEHIHGTLQLGVGHMLEIEFDVTLFFIAQFFPRALDLDFLP